MRHYLDHAATSVLLPVAREAFLGAVDTLGNPASLHTSGRRARMILEESREELAEALGAEPAEIIWTSGGTEADNLALIGGWQAHYEISNRVIVSAIEHPAIAESAVASRHRGADLVVGQVTPSGVIDLAAAAWREPAAVVSVMMVNNETGVIQPLDALAEACAAQLLHTDAVQAVGHVPFDFAGLPVQLASVSAHKIGGPVGIGALLARKQVVLRPTSYGGRQERELRSGTQAPALASAFAAAAAWVRANQEGEAKRLAGLRDRLEGEICALVPGAVVNGSQVARSPAISNITFAGCRADDLLLLLDACRIDSSTGSACAAGVSQPSQVLMAMGRSREEASASLRFSLGWTTTEEDISALLAAVGPAVERAQAAGRAVAE